MSVQFSNALLTIDHFWTDFKNIVLQKGLSIQYEETSTIYAIFAIEEPQVVYSCNIYLGAVPVYTNTAPGQDPGIQYTQVQNDLDKADFETYFKDLANRPIARSTHLVFGYASTTNTTNVPVNASAYTEQTTNAQRSIVSTSANDTAAGTGARSVRVTYYDQALAQRSTVDLALNGTTPVDTGATDLCFIERMDVLTVGSNGSNEGTINLKAATGGGGATIGSIPVGDTQTNWSHHYIRDGWTCYVRMIRVGSKGSSNGQVTLRKTRPTVANTPAITLNPTLRIQAGGQATQEYEQAEIPVVGPARISLHVQQDAASGTNTWFAGLAFRET